MLTMYEQCTQALRGVLAFYAHHKTCPCAFPRFAQLVQFNFQDYGTSPVGCHATELAIALVTDEKAHLYRPTDKDRRSFTCTLCGSEIDYFWEQYNINLDVARLQFRQIHAAPLGPAPSGPIPMPRGFFGFDNAAINRCAAAFSHEGSFADLAAYLQELRQP